MRLTDRQLRTIIEQVISEAPKKSSKGGGRASLGFAVPEDSVSSKSQKIGHLSQLKAVHPRAYRSFVAMLIKGSKEEFSLEDGVVVAHRPYTLARGNGKMVFDPDGTTMDVAGSWEEVRTPRKP